jgi:Cys-tRNA(Pro)/Cys-tRNA(Cys) deacylase
MSKPRKTNACRLLDQLAIAYELRSYEVDPDDLSAESVAAKIGLPATQVFKTLCVAADDRAILLAVVPGDRELDLKALARAAHKRSVDPLPLKQLLETTGYVRGGVTALACKKPFPVFLDAPALAFDRISISSGQRGLQIVLAPVDYQRATDATVGALSRPKLRTQVG